MPLSVSSMKHHYLELVWYKALAELRAEAARAYLGFLWWIFEPVIYMTTFYFVFSVIFHRGGEDFVPFLLCGLVAWKWFASSVMSSSGTISANAGLMQQVYLPKYLFPAIVLVINSVKYFVVLGLLLGFLLLYGYRPSEAWLALPVIIGVQFLLIAAVAGIVSALVPFVPDFRLILDNVIMLLFFLSGIFFDITTVSEPIRRLLEINPMAVIISAYRTVLLDGNWPEAAGLLISFGESMIGIAIAAYIFRRYDRVYPKVLI